MSSLSKCVNAWKSLPVSDNVLRWIEHGVKIPFKREPESVFLNNHKLSKSQCTFVDNKVTELLASKFISKVSYVPKCVSPLGCVSKRGGKFRLITDLRHVNECCDTPKFRYEDISVLPNVVDNNDKLVTIDLKDGFFHVPVHNDYRTFLGFCWKNIYYVWNVLPFGLQSSPYFFCKTLRPVIEYLREQGLRLLVYVDDILICASVENIDSNTKLVLHTLSSLGFTVNVEKSSLEPENIKEFLGFLVDTSGDSVTIRVPKPRIRKIRTDIRRALEKNVIRARTLARLIGQCVATTKAVLPGKLKLRSAYRLLHTKSNWDSVLHWSHAAKCDFEWWVSAFETWNGCSVIPKTIDAQLTTDASRIGWGGTLEGKKAQGFWDKSIGQSHSNIREMWAVLMALISFRDQVSGRTIQVVSDNISTVAYLNHMGGPSVELNQLATAIWAEAINNHVSLTCCHIPGKQNVVPDHLSRLNDKYEWQLNPALFRLLDEMWGPHTVDRFASILTAQLDNFNSRFYHPQASGVDALAQQNWATHNNFVNAPFRLIPRVLDVLRSQQADATIIAPLWKAQPWYRLLKSASVCPPLTLPNSTKTVISTWGHAEPLQNPRWKLYAWRVSGTKL